MKRTPSIIYDYLFVELLEEINNILIATPLLIYMVLETQSKTCAHFLSRKNFEID